MARVLKLDASFQPVEIVNWTEAFRLLFLGKAEIVEEYEDKSVHSPTQEFKVPSVIKLLTAVASRKQRVVRFSRENIFIRDGYTCQYCGFHGNYKGLTLDHVLPASKGGPKSWKNIVTACEPCNTKKADKTLGQARMRLLKEPCQPRWTPRIAVKLRDFDPVAWNNYVTY